MIQSFRIEATGRSAAEVEETLKAAGVLLRQSFECAPDGIAPPDMHVVIERDEELEAYLPESYRGRGTLKLDASPDGVQIEVLNRAGVAVSLPGGRTAVPGERLRLDDSEFTVLPHPSEFDPPFGWAGGVSVASGSGAIVRSTVTLSSSEVPVEVDPWDELPDGISHAVNLRMEGLFAEAAENGWSVEMVAGFIREEVALTYNLARRTLDGGGPSFGYVPEIVERFRDLSVASTDVSVELAKACSQLHPAVQAMLNEIDRLHEVPQS